MPVVNPQAPSSDGAILSSICASHGSNTTESGMHADARTKIAASLSDLQSLSIRGVCFFQKLPDRAHRRFCRHADVVLSTQTHQLGCAGDV